MKKNPEWVEFMIDAFCEEHLEYCWFETVDDLIQDHKTLKKHIKKREKQLEKHWKMLASGKLWWIQYIMEDIEAMSHEMMSINM